MNRDCGPIKSQIWLIGDSEPGKYSDKLENPLDLKHPTVHNIFTPILEQIQDEIFCYGNRIDRRKIYIRNAVKSSNDWEDDFVLNEEILNLKNLITEHSPIIITPFGTRAFEFVRRALGEKNRRLNYWTTYRMGKEFTERCQTFDVNNTNIIPLLHASICRGNFLVAHSRFCDAIKTTNGINEENYFIAAGKMIAPILINNKSSFNCWKIAS